MADVNYKNAQEYLSDVRQEHARLEALVHPTGTNRRKRQATAKKKTLAVEHLEAINELLESVGEWDDDELSMVGTKYLPEGNDEEENLARPEANNDWCNHDQCHNVNPATYQCYTCQNSYCGTHVQDNVASGVTYIGTDHSSLTSGVDGGHIFCQECASELVHPVVNINEIAGNTFECDADTDGNEFQQKMFNQPALKGTNRYKITGTDIKSPYNTKQADRPITIDNETPYEVHQIPEKKPVKQKRQFAIKRMTQRADLNKNCPACNNCDGSCNVKCANGVKVYPAGMAHLQKQRDRLTFLLDREEIDQAYNYVMQHVSFKPIKKAHYCRIFKKMTTNPNTVAGREARGITCPFCKRADATNCPGISIIDESDMIPHTSRSKKCGVQMTNACNKYLAHCSASQNPTCTLPGPPGGAEQVVPLPFFQRLFCLSERTLRRKIAEKRNGKLGSTFEDSRAKGGRGSGLTPLQHANLEAILKEEEFPQTQSHYAPASEGNDYRYEVGVSKGSFWWKYCEKHDPKFYEQCNRVNHKHGLDDTRQRPTDETYLADAREQNDTGNMSDFNFNHIESIYNERKTMRESIITLTAKKVEEETLALQEQNREHAEQHEIEAAQAAVQILVLENKLKTMTKCNIPADVSYSSALRFYKQYSIKTGKIGQDTCKTCESLCMKIKHNTGAAKAKFEKQFKEHLHMADEGYKWRAQDRERAMEADSKTHMMVIDFGQALRTPTLSTGTSWYRRILKGSCCIVLHCFVCS